MATSTKLPTRPLGKNGPQVTRMGLGVMVLSGVYSVPASDEERLAFLDAAYDKGERFWDTADEYGDNLELLGKWFVANPEKRKDIFLGSKFAVQIDRSGEKPVISVDSSPEYCQAALEKQLKRLNQPYIDVFYVHRVDKITPIEKTIEAMVELKNAGKIKYLGLSECSADTLRRAHAVHPISCVQVEYSPFCLAIESPTIRVLETARKLGIAIVAYSPLGNGFITGTLRKPENFTKPGDQRKVLPWLSEQNLEKNLAVVDKISEIAKSKGVTMAQLTLAWLLAQGDDVFPIPGTTKVHRLEENLGSLFVSITPDEEKEIRELAKAIVGGRFQDTTGYAFGDTPLL